MLFQQEGKLVIFGGVDHIEENTRINRVYTAWLIVPSLRYQHRVYTA